MKRRTPFEKSFEIPGDTDDLSKIDFGKAELITDTPFFGTRKKRAPLTAKRTRRKARKKRRRPNPWIQHVKQVQAENPSVPYKQILVLAKLTYKKSVSRRPPGAITIRRTPQLSREPVQQFPFQTAPTHGFFSKFK